MFMHQGKQVRKSDLLLALCRAIPREVLDQGTKSCGVCYVLNFIL